MLSVLMCVASKIAQCDDCVIFGGINIQNAAAMDISNENNPPMPSTINNVALGLAFFAGYTPVLDEDQDIVARIAFVGTASTNVSVGTAS